MIRHGLTSSHSTKGRSDTPASAGEAGASLHGGFSSRLLRILTSPETALEQSASNCALRASETAPSQCVACVALHDRRIDESTCGRIQVRLAQCTMQAARLDINDGG